MSVCPTLRDRARCGELVAIVLLIIAVALLLDVAIAERALFQWQFHRDWWGRASSGCWIVERLCVPGRSKEDGALTIWQEWPADISELGCVSTAQRYWRECLRPTLGLVSASFRASGQILTQPAGSEHYVGLHSAMSVALSGGLRLLAPGGAAWTLEICNDGACRQLAVDAFCDGRAEELSQEAVLPMRASCREVHDGTWPPCGPESFQSACAAQDVDADIMRRSCEWLCPALQHAHNIFSLALAASFTVLVIIASFLIRGRWCRHSGCLTALLAVLCASAVLACFIVLHTVDISDAFAVAADAHKEEASGREQHAGMAELAGAAVALALSAFAVVGSSKDGQTLEYKLAEYERFNFGLRQATRMKHQHQEKRQEEAAALEDACAAAEGQLEKRSASREARSHSKRPSVEAFQARGDEERLSYADGVLTRTSFDACTAPVTSNWRQIEEQIARQQSRSIGPLRPTPATPTRAQPAPSHSNASVPYVGKPRLMDQWGVFTRGPVGYNPAAQESRGPDQAWQDNTPCYDDIEGIDVQIVD